MDGTHTLVVMEMMEAVVAVVVAAAMDMMAVVIKALLPPKVLQDHQQLLLPQHPCAPIGTMVGTTTLVKLQDPRPWLDLRQP